MRYVLVAGLLILAVGLLQAVGILAILPQCGFGFNFFIVSGCLSPITVYGLNPNLASGLLFGAIGLVLVVISERMEAN